MINAPYFLARKLEAFYGRGKNEYRASHDLEDIITIMDGCPEIVKELSIAEPELRRCLSDQFQVLLGNRDFREALPGHLLPDAASQQRVGLVIERMKQLILGN